MKNCSFDVLREPWIPVVFPGGNSGETGILDCLEKAHELREIRSPAPLVEFGIHRLLVAFVLDALILNGERPEDPEDLRELLERGCFDTGVLREYAKECGDVFDLFHPENPFLQTFFEGKKQKPLAAMFPPLPSGTNTILWHHAHEKDWAVSPGEAVRLLSTIAPFMTSGGAGLAPSINGAPALYVLPLGKTLFETLVLNLPFQRSGNEGCAAWRNFRVPGDSRFESTLLEGLTWRPRKIRLIPEKTGDGDTVVRTMYFEPGDKTEKSLEWRDPNLAYRFDKEGRKPVRMRENRPVWRDAGPLMLLQEFEYGKEEKKVAFRRPDVVGQAFDILEGGGELYSRIYGMRTDMKMKYFEWVCSPLALPRSLGRSTRLGACVEKEIGRGEEGAKNLRKGLNALFPEDQRDAQSKKKGQKKLFRTMVHRAEREYWKSLEPHFHALLQAFGKLPPDAPDITGLVPKTASEWRKSIRISALEQFEHAAKDMDTDSKALERLVHAREQLKRYLAKTIGEVV